MTSESREMQLKVTLEANRQHRHDRIYARMIIDNLGIGCEDRSEKMDRIVLGGFVNDRHLRTFDTIFENLFYSRKQRNVWLHETQVDYDSRTYTVCIVGKI